MRERGWYVPSLAIGPLPIDNLTDAFNKPSQSTQKEKNRVKPKIQLISFPSSAFQDGRGRVFKQSEKK